MALDGRWPTATSTTRLSTAQEQRASKLSWLKVEKKRRRDLDDVDVNDAKPEVRVHLSPRHREIEQITDKFLDRSKLFENGSLPFQFGYINSNYVQPDLLNVLPGQESSIPIPKSWAIDEPLLALVKQNLSVVPMITRPFFSESFKVYTEATPCSYFFDGQDQPEQEFSRIVAKGATVHDLLVALYEIFADAKVHPHETIFIDSLEVVDGSYDVHIEYSR
jgi:hypothetical protein